MGTANLPLPLSVTHHSVLGSIAATFSSTSLQRGTSPFSGKPGPGDGAAFDPAAGGVHVQPLDLKKVVDHVYASTNLPTLGASVVPTEKAGGAQGAGSGGAPHQQHGRVGLFDNENKDGSHAGGSPPGHDPNRHNS
jgi:hypothetical protein